MLGILLALLTVFITLHIFSFDELRKEENSQDFSVALRTQFLGLLLSFGLILFTVYPIVDTCEDMLNLSMHIMKEGNPLYGLSYNVDIKVKLILLMSLFMCLSCLLFFSTSILEVSETARMEYYIILAVLFFSSVALIVFVEDLLMFYLLIELMSICSYILVGFHRNSVHSLEAAIKYLIVSALFSSVMLYGIALMYYLTGNTNLIDLSELISNGDTLLAIGALTKMKFRILYVSIAFIFIGLMFKLGAGLFHVWPAQVYSGAPIEVSFVLNVVTKIPVLYFLVYFVQHIQPDCATYSVVLPVMGVLSIVLGTVNALISTDIRKIFAYSSTAFSGLFFVALTDISATRSDDAALIIFSYAILLFISWGILSLVKTLSVHFSLLEAGSKVSDEKIYSVSNFLKILEVAKSSKNNALAFTLLFIFSAYFIIASGLPPFIGFEIKAYILSMLSHAVFSAENNILSTTVLFVYLVIFVFLSIFSMSLYVVILKKISTAKNDTTLAERRSDKEHAEWKKLVSDLEYTTYYSVFILLSVIVFAYITSMDPTEILTFLEALQNIFRSIF